MTDPRPPEDAMERIKHLQRVRCGEIRSLKTDELAWIMDLALRALSAPAREAEWRPGEPVAWLCEEANYSFARGSLGREVALHEFEAAERRTEGWTVTPLVPAPPKEIKP